MRWIPVTLRRGRLIHLVSEGSDSPRTTLCRRDADRAVLVPADADGKHPAATCVPCLQWVARRAR